MFHCSVIKDRFALPFVSNSFAIISCCFLPVKKFFQLFLKLFLTFRLISVNFDILSQLTLYCQELFSFLFSTVFVSCSSDIIAFISVFVNYLLTFFYILKMSTLKSTFFHVFIVLLFCTIRSLFYSVFLLLGSTVVRLPLLPASHAPCIRYYASCFTSSLNNSPAEW